MSTAAQYLYREGNTLHVMKSEGYDNLSIDVGLVEGGPAAAQLLREGMAVTLQVRFRCWRGPRGGTCALKRAGRAGAQ
jgi:translation elongation factor P/translation initiation factor 5A